METPYGYIFNGIVSNEALSRVNASRQDDRSRKIAAVGEAASTSLDALLYDVRTVVETFAKLDYAAMSREGERDVRHAMVHALRSLGDAAKDQLYASATLLEIDTAPPVRSPRKIGYR